MKKIFFVSILLFFSFSIFAEGYKNIEWFTPREEIEEQKNVAELSETEKEFLITKNIKNFVVTEEYILNEKTNVFYDFLNVTKKDTLTTVIYFIPQKKTKQLIKLLGEPLAVYKNKEIIPKKELVESFEKEGFEYTDNLLKFTISSSVAFFKSQPSEILEWEEYTNKNKNYKSTLYVYRSDDTTKINVFDGYIEGLTMVMYFYSPKDY